MKTLSDETRQLQRCGYLPIIEEGTRAWCHAGAADNFDEGGPSVCPGYSTKLAQVREASFARLHWKNGCLRDWAEGPPSPVLLEAIEVIECESNAADAWHVKNASKGGGRGD